MAKKEVVPTTKSGIMAALAEAGEVSKKQAVAIYDRLVDLAIKGAKQEAKGFMLPALGTVKLVIALFVTQLVAFPFAILFGKLASKFSCEKLLIVCIGAYAAIGVLAVFLRFEWQFWAMAVGVGMFQGGIQAMSRSYFTKIIPAEKSGEFFGLYDIFGKSASIIGLGLISVLSTIFPLADATWINLSLLPLPVLFAIGLVLFLLAIKTPASEDCKLSQEQK